jgi:hypothetical protein
MIVDIMLDLETLDDKVPAVITQIGAIAFDRKTRTIIDDFTINIDASSCQKRGMTISGDTVMWWLKQDEGARKSLADPIPVNVEVGLLAFRNWLVSHFPSTRSGVRPVGETEKFRVWCHASFDFPIVTRAFELCDIPPPWGYRDYRDLRTMADFADIDVGSYVVVDEGSAHNALADARYQLRYTFAALEKLDRKQ